VTCLLTLGCARLTNPTGTTTQSSNFAWNLSTAVAVETPTSSRHISRAWKPVHSELIDLFIE